MNRFPDILKRLRKDRGLTQSEVADACGVVKSAVCNWEKGQRIPEDDTLEALSDLFNVDLSYLMGESEKSTLLVMEKDPGYDATTYRSISAEEIALLSQYRKLAPDEKALVRELFAKASKTPGVWKSLESFLGK